MGGIERSFAKALLSKNKNDRDNRYIRGSSIGACCRRIGYQLLGYQGIPDTGHSMSVLDLGNAIHDVIQRNLVNIGWIKAKPIINNNGTIDWEQTDDILSGCELPILNHNLRIIGHCDGVTVPLVKTVKNGVEEFTPGEDGERYLIEIKSITDRSSFWVLGIRDGGTGPISEESNPSEFIELSYEASSSGGIMQKLGRFQHKREVRGKFGSKECGVYKLKIDNKDELVTVIMAGDSMGSFSALKKPKAEHILQASLYARELGLEKILFLYIGKDVDSRHYSNNDSLFNVPMKIFEWTVTALDINLIDSKIARIYEAVDRGELPSKDYNFEEKKSPCRYCPYNWQCYPDRVDEAKLKGINLELEEISLPTLQKGPGVLHRYKKDLATEYKGKNSAI
jgi:hypothetical protein